MRETVDGRILITGDLHSDTGALTMILKQMLPSDILMVAGDFGYLFRNNSDEKSWLNDVDLFLRRNDLYILFVDGNHENHRALREFPVEAWQGAKVHKIRSRIVHVLRGEILTLKGKKIYCFGGAFSIDRAYRTLNKSWWEEEIPTDEDYKNGNNNLENCEYKVDYIVTHTCPVNLIVRLGSYHAAAEERQLQNYFQWISEITSFEKWYFGHWHQDQELGEKYRAIYLDVIDVGTGEKVW